MNSTQPPQPTLTEPPAPVPVPYQLLRLLEDFHRAVQRRDAKRAQAAAEAEKAA